VIPVWSKMKHLGILILKRQDRLNAYHPTSQITTLWYAVN
jgi:hypothetical protein